MFEVLVQLFLNICTMYMPHAVNFRFTDVTRKSLLNLVVHRYIQTILWKVFIGVLIS